LGVINDASDCLDAEAIAEAVQRPRIRFVSIKTEEQLDLQALHRSGVNLESSRQYVIGSLMDLPKSQFSFEQGIRNLQNPTTSRKRNPAAGMWFDEDRSVGFH